MTDDITSKIEAAKAQLELARTQAGAKINDTYLETFDVYTATLRHFYQHTDQASQKEMLAGLEKVMDDLQEKEKINRKKKISSNFDTERAKQLRIEKGFKTAHDLAVVVAPDHSRMFYRYESGETIPRNPPRSDAAKIYLGWLKDNGYNPYNL